VNIDDQGVPLASSPFGPKTGGSNASAVLFALGLMGMVATGIITFKKK